MADNNPPPPALTPLGAACAKGHLPTIQNLLSAGADPDAPDAQGWTAKEHAAFSGHLRIAAYLETLAPRKLDPPLAVSKAEAREQAWLPWERGGYEGFEGTWVWVVLGSLDAKRAVPVVEFDGCEGWDAGEKGLVLSVWADGDPEGGFSAELPVEEGNVNSPWLFRVRSLEELRLIWKLEEPQAGGAVVGSGVAMAKDWDAGLAVDKESLRRAGSVALQAPDMSYVGRVNFSHFAITPFPPPPELAGQKCWRFGNGVGGHRGSGKNRLNHKQLQIGENSAQSFQTAVDHGASFLEDHVPVIYHDLLSSELGADTRIQDLTFDQFNAINTDQGPRLPREKRSNSLVEADTPRLDALTDRMSHTNFNKINGFKANTRGTFIRENTTSLDDFLRRFSRSTSLNLEIKYPMLFETTDWTIDPVAIKANTYTDTILHSLYTHTSPSTNLVLSSFNPEICIALASKQRIWPVFFLSKTLAPKGEVRSQSVEQAVEFAEAWKLPGIVVECTPLVQCPRLIGWVKGRGLRLMSFGSGNSNVESAKIQFDAGIDAVITDTVGAIVGLRGKEGSAEEVWP
ncbi:hypothetical protein MBLNU230_g6565t1 [Neophaeotheca triangularis]